MSESDGGRRGDPKADLKARFEAMTPEEREAASKKILAFYKFFVLLFAAVAIMVALSRSG